MSGLLPIFPLRLVAFPGIVIPLHIFEPRYKEMVGEAAAHGTEFGIVLAKDDSISAIGCTVVVEEVSNQQPDGSFDVTTRGKRRFRILSIDREREYLRADVEFFEDEDPAQESPSFELARSVQDLDLQSAILRSRSETERMQYLLRHTMKQTTPRNGSGHKSAAP